MSAVPQGENTLYRAEASLFVDSSNEQLSLTGQSNQFLYATDEYGRRFSIVTRSQSSGPAVTVKPGEPVKFSLTFLAPSNSRNLYMTGDMRAPFWVRLYFGSDLNPFHRRTLLRIV